MKRKHHEDHVNHEAWAIPYADLMTLLLAFFVVMYAVSVVNEGKYRVMSESIIEAFNGSSHVIAPMPPTNARPHNVDPAIAAPRSQPGAAAAPVAVPIPLRPASRRIVAQRAPHETLRDVQAAQEAQRQANLTRIQHEVEKALQPLIDKQQVVVRRTPNWLEIEIRTDILFPSGVAQLSHQADAVLSNLGGILAPFGNPLRIEGYTDDKPINTAVFPSNWELSAARAASVARLFTEHGVSPARLGIIGWGQFRPAADNTTVEGRNRNRRVLVVVLSDHATPTRYSGGTDRIGQLADATPSAGTAAEPDPSAAALAGAGAPPSAPKAAVHVVEAPLIVMPGRAK
ncbi:flagellar motor protein MotD [Frateuria sp. MAH-13]|uniref:Flagellar motor protein MotD n=1 Tax=Frateuria flava TaxID=2821489 RepID=A0ABS4DK24_9GAMM|nr:flagellar motor protein MotD [Frateuria flava]MBP1473401.1 flagellar motor protein MotD [Frateuria flava]